MFRGVRRYAAAILVALQELVAHVARIGAELHTGEGDDGLASRVDALERSRALWEAEIEATLSRAEQERKNARNAEERARVMVRNAGLAEDDEEGEEGLPDEVRELLALRRGNEAGSGEARVSPVRNGVGSTREAKKAAARRFKFGG